MIAQREDAVQTPAHNGTTQMRCSFQVELVIQVERPFREKQTLMEVLLYLTGRTRTVISQAHSSQWLGTFGNPGNGRYRAELRQALSAIDRYLASHQLSQGQALLRFDGQY